MMRIGLFLLTNLAVLLVAGTVLSLLGVTSYLDASGTGLNLQALLVFCAVFGFGGAFVSLFLSKFMAKMGTGAKIISGTEGARERWLVERVAALAQKAGIGMPEVAIFPMRQPNAFATGWNRNNALVAISRGMLDTFPDDEVEAVMAHEIGHVANGDMITLTLLQGVVNTFVMFLARIIGFVVDRVVLKNQRGLGIGFFLTTIVAEIVLAILASMIVMWFSRRREYRADAAGATFASREGMINALERLRRLTGKEEQLPESMVAFGITGEGKLAMLFRSHPPLEDRIARLKHGA